MADEGRMNFECYEYFGVMSSKNGFLRGDSRMIDIGLFHEHIKIQFFKKYHLKF
jgi:hypothetical protein